MWRKNAKVVLPRLEWYFGNQEAGGKERESARAAGQAAEKSYFGSHFGFSGAEAQML
jgi:hypothetical protein